MATESAAYVFTVIDAVPGDRTALISTQPLYERLKILDGRELGFELRTETQEEAEMVARFLNDHIAKVLVFDK